MDTDRAVALACTLLDQHGLTNWTFQYDNAKRRFGYCNYRTRTVSLSKHLVALNDEAEVVDTILHEIAHALVGSGNGHNHVWKAKCVEVGARPERTYDDAEVVTPIPNWHGTCRECGHTYKRHRLRRSVRVGGYCHKCGGSLEWTRVKVTAKDGFTIEFVQGELA